MVTDHLFANMLRCLSRLRRSKEIRDTAATAVEAEVASFSGRQHDSVSNYSSHIAFARPYSTDLKMESKEHLSERLSHQQALKGAFPTSLTSLARSTCDNALKLTSFSSCSAESKMEGAASEGTGCSGEEAASEAGTDTGGEADQSTVEGRAQASKSC